MTARLAELKPTRHSAWSEAAIVAGTWAGIAIQSLLFAVLFLIVISLAALGLVGIVGEYLWKRAKR
ncbi:hypothetical protein ACLE20_13285 [Rhizobium sp. YIM 134829]|uniref:hypothetical protein n=1 Tax=Rhizobium sp. YIM 134829 TaxID=3390453 RepID=UPI00397BB471